MSYSHKVEVARDIVKHWQNFAIENLLDLLSFNSYMEITSFSLHGLANDNETYNTHLYVNISKEQGGINVQIFADEFNQEEYERVRIERENERQRNPRIARQQLRYRVPGNNDGYVQVEVVNCNLKNLLKHVNFENAPQFIDLARSVVQKYKWESTVKNQVVDLIDETKQMGVRKVSKEFLTEKI